MNAILPGAPRLCLLNPAESWNLILQSGVGIDCTVNTPLRSVLREDFSLTDEQLAPIDCFLLDGMPVDEPEQALVAEGSRLALAAGLPGIVGLALKRNSGVKALRAGISHPMNAGASGEDSDGLNGAVAADTAENTRQRGPGRGRIILALYSLALPQLAPHFLRMGIYASPAQVLRYSRFAPESPCRCNGMEGPIAALEEELRAAPAEREIFLYAEQVG